MTHQFVLLPQLFKSILETIIIIILFFKPWVARIPRDLGKNDTKEKKVGVTITPGSAPEQRNRAAERCYIAARARKRAGTKTQSPARRTAPVG